MGSTSAICPICGTSRMLTNEGRIYKHTAQGRNGFCDGSGYSTIPAPRAAVEDDPMAWLMNQGANGPEPSPMTPEAQEIATRLKEIFYAYANRQSSDNRSAQTHLGPSEIGTPCDRRLAMSLLRVPPVNPGGDGWASFVGTCVHAGLAQMLQWADAGAGRFAVEQQLAFPSVVVPKGTGDALDRVLLAVIDHKLMGQWSLTKLMTDGPTSLYRTQIHVYGHGFRLQGEKVEKVAIVGWPRTESNLDNLYVWCEDYDPTVARDAFDRVHRIESQIASGGLSWQAFPVAKDCAYCPYHLKDGDNTKGCNGKQ